MFLLLFLVLPNFVDRTKATLERLEDSNCDEFLEDNEFIRASHLVYDGVREVRTAVLMNRRPEEIQEELSSENKYQLSSGEK